MAEPAHPKAADHDSKGLHDEPPPKGESSHGGRKDHSAPPPGGSGHTDSSGDPHHGKPGGSPSHASHPTAPAFKRSEGLCGPLPRKRIQWTRKDGALVLRGTVVVGPGQILSIGPGVQVRAATRDACPDSSGRDGTTLLVLAGGTLEVAGTPSAPVRFAPDSLAKGFSWGGLRLEKTRKDQAKLSWLEISGAKTGISFLAGEGEVAHATIVRCGVGLAALGGGAPVVRHSVFHRTAISDVVSKKSSPHLWGNLFLEGGTDGIRFDGVGLARVEGNCFWSHRGEAIVRGPVGSGGWKADTLPDRFGNWKRDPLLRSSDSALKLARARQRALDTASWWTPRRPLPDPPGSGPWALSAHSPLLDVGPRLCKDVDGSTCDIGLWGGK